VKELKCFRCGEEIYFDPNKKSQKGKPIPLDLDTEQPHNCPKSNYRESKSLVQQMKDAEKRDSERFKRQIRPKHTIKDLELFAKDKAKVGGLILEGMKITGGTDIDWLIEHRGGFIVMENKEFNGDSITIKQGQMIAFEKLYDKLNSDNKCHFLVFGSDNIDFKNPNSVTHYFDMKDWKDRKVSSEFDSKYKKYRVFRKDMIRITLKAYRELIESFWKEFEKD